jgi:hypothetical protein
MITIYMIYSMYCCVFYLEVQFIIYYYIMHERTLPSRAQSKFITLFLPKKAFILK